MNISKEGLDLIKRYEGLRLKAYKPVSTEKYCTIGYGHYGADVTYNMVITEQKAEELLSADVHKFEVAVESLGRAWTQNQFDALVSFAYNCGVANLKRLVTNRTNAQIGHAMNLYVNAGGKKLNGLVKRRKEESDLFLRK